MSGNRTVKFADKAPEFLKGIHEYEGKSPKLLGVLLSDKRMLPVWARLGRQIKTNHQWKDLWQAIKMALHDASPKRKPKRAEDESDDIRWIAVRASELAAVIKIEGRKEKGYKGFFDFECHHFSPDIVMQINGIPEWSSRNWQDQSLLAIEVMTSWPTMSELLDGLATHALAKAEAVKKKRMVLKDKGCWAETMFVRQLHMHLKQYPWETRDYHFANIAIIGTLAWESNFLKIKGDGGIDARFVGNAIRGIPQPTS